MDGLNRERERDGGIGERERDGGIEWREREREMKGLNGESLVYKLQYCDSHHASQFRTFSGIFRKES